MRRAQIANTILVNSSESDEDVIFVSRTSQQGQPQNDF